jgi:hypothetical protein
MIANYLLYFYDKTYYLDLKIVIKEIYCFIIMVKYLRNNYLVSDYLGSTKLCYFTDKDFCEVKITKKLSNLFNYYYSN